MLINESANNKTEQNNHNTNYANKTHTNNITQESIKIWLYDLNLNPKLNV
jgi:hypothetical protein